MIDYLQMRGNEGRKKERREDCDECRITWCRRQCGMKDGSKRKTDLRERLAKRKNMDERIPETAKTKLLIAWLS